MKGREHRGFSDGWGDQVSEVGAFHDRGMVGICSRLCQGIRLHRSNIDPPDRTSTLFRHRLISFPFLVSTVAVILCLTSTVAHADVDSGIQWLLGQAQSNGQTSTTDDLATPLQSTAEAVRTFTVADNNDPRVDSARQFIQAETFSNTESLYRRIINAVEGGTLDPSLIEALLEAARSDGSFGDQPGFDPTNLDTALALEGLAVASQTSSTTAGFATGYALAQQNTDGGWSLSRHAPNDRSSVFVTATMVNALAAYRSQFNVETELGAGIQYLLNQRNADNLWGQAFRSALALIALVNTLDDFSPIADSLSALRGQQQPNGSWAGDVYSTALALRALIQSVQPPTNPGLATITGQAVNGQTGLALSNVTVTLDGPSPKTLVTDSSGAFQFNDLIAGSYELQLTLPGFVPITAGTQLSPGQTVDFGAIQLLPQATTTTGTIRGVIADAGTGQPLEDVSITLSGAHRSSTLTDAQGQYQFTGVTAGAVTIQATRAGYSTATGQATITAGGLFLFSASLTPVTEPQTVLQGTVTHGETGGALEGATIAVTGATNAGAITDGAGQYQIALTPGDVTITASLAGFDTVVATATIFEHNVYRFSPALYPENTAPPDTNTAGITGVVLDAGTNQALSGVAITATFGTESFNTTTDADGRFNLTGISVLDGNLLFQLAGYVDSTLDVTLVPLQILDIGQVRLRPEEAEVLQPDLIISTLVGNTDTDPHTLAVTGNIAATVQNIGTAPARGAIALLAFYDADHNGGYDPDVDSELGQSATVSGLEVNAIEEVAISIQGMLPYRDAPISVWVDSAEISIELNENNNVIRASDLCRSEPGNTTFEPALKWEWTGSVELPAYDSVIGLPVVVPLEDTNGDGGIDDKDIPAIVFHSYSQAELGRGAPGVLRAISGLDGRELWSVTDPALRTEATSQLAAGDIDNDGLVEIIASAPMDETGMLAFEHTGDFKWRSIEPTTRPGPLGVFWGGAAIADLDQDGVPEIVVGRDVLNNDGSLRWKGSGSFEGANVHGPLSSVTDIDNDGSLEVIVGASVYSSTGELLWINGSAGDGYTAVGNFDDDVFAEIVLVRSNRVSVLEHTGDIKWGPVGSTSSNAGGPPAVADMDGDGYPEIGVAGRSSYRVLNHDGSLLWSSEINDTSAVTGSSVFDFESDGAAEVVYADLNFLRVYRGTDGAKLVQLPNPTSTTFEYPLIVDVDTDNHAEIVMVANSSSGDNGIRVFENAQDDWVNTRRIWNQHAYHIDNVNDDGTIPQFEQPSWLAHNTYRLNTFRDRDPLSSPDLTASMLHVTAENDGGSRLQVLIGNAGAAPNPSGTTVSFYEGAPDPGGTLIGTADVPILEPDSAADVALENVTNLSGNQLIFAVVDADNDVIECREDNNSVDIPGPDLKPDLTVSSVDRSGIDTDLRNLLIEGAVNATVENIGTLASPAGVEVVTFNDHDRNGRYDSDIDTLLGETFLANAIPVGDAAAISILVSGSVPFRGAPLLVFVDSSERVEEESEDNNINTTSSICHADPLPGALQFRTKWHWRHPSFTTNPHNVFGPPMVGQLTDDNLDGVINQEDIPDLVFAASGTLNAVSGDTGAEIWARQVDISSVGSVSLGDIDNDGIIEILYVNNRRSRMVSVEHTGETKWNKTINPSRRTGPRDGLAIADIDNDGAPEIIHGRRVYNASGSLRWAGSRDNADAGSYGYLSFAADVDLDGQMEIVAGRTLYSSTGSVKWHKSNISSDGYNAVGNFDEDDFAEIVLVSSGRVYVLEHDGTIKWGPKSIPGGGRGGSPTVSDVDSDGEPEIGVAGRNRYAVFETSGTLKWSRAIQDASSSRTGSSTFDFNGDGDAEIIYSDERNFFVFDGRTGSTLTKINNGSGTTLEYPLVADVDGDGHAEIVVPSNNGLSNSSAVQGVRVLESVNDDWMPTRRIWNQHTYHINNVNDDGTIPQFETPSWLTHNTFRLNTFADRDPLDSTDLTASFLRIIDNGAGRPLSLQVRIGNAGLIASPNDVAASFYSGDPLAGGSLIGMVLIDSLSPGQYRDVQLDGVEILDTTQEIHAFADAAEQVVECDETNNIVHAPIEDMALLGDIEVATNAAAYGPNAAVGLSGVITNLGSLDSTFVAQLQIEASSGVLVQRFDAQTFDPLGDGEAAGVDETWNTGTFLAGTYILRGILRNLEGELVDEATTSFQIVHSTDATDPAVALRITTDRPVYHTSDTVNILDLVRNITANVVVADAVLQVTVHDPSGALFFSDTLALGQLVPGAARDLSTPLNLDQAPQGEYVVTGRVRSEGRILASDQTTFQVEENLALTVTGTVTVQLDQLEIGDPQVCTDHIANTGAGELVNLPIHQVLARLDEAGEISTQSTSLTLAAGGARTLIRNVDTTALEEGDYACVLQAQIDDTWQTLDFDTFRLNEPPIRISGSFSPGDRGRVLILLDDDQGLTCGGVSEVSLNSTFETPLAETDSITVQVLDEFGAVSDTETVLVGDFTGPIDAQPGTGGLNLALTGVDAEQLSLHLTGSGTETLGPTVQITAHVDQGSQTLNLDSLALDTDCDPPLIVGESYGDFALTGFDTVAAANDPLGPNHRPDLASQRHYLETLLTQAGWSYTLVTDPNDFARELRGGGYATYLLLSEHVKLSEPVQKELREAVFRGEGLVEAGSHDQRQGRIDDALGIKFKGKHPHMGGVFMPESVLHEESSQIEFRLDDKTLRAEPQGADIVGHYLDAGSGLTDELAVSAYAYGEGTSVYAGFDLLAEATLAGVDSPAGQVILYTLDYAHPDALVPATGGVFPIRIALTNEGIATPGRVILPLPEEIEVIDPGTGSVDAEHTLIWSFDLAEAQTQTLNAWIRLTDTPVELAATIQVGVDPDYQDHAGLTLDLEPLAPTTVAEALAFVETLDGKTYKQVRKDLENAQSDWQSADAAGAREHLLKATDRLIKIDTPESAQARLLTARALRTVTMWL